ncbi:MAG TPA: response regulator transcription factor [Vicinamibacterales bacterium]|nr:response regulator transcription factor [Vicinamibacterales bacterium]
MSALNDARAAFDRGAWNEVFSALTTIDARTPLEPEDLDRLATAATLVGEGAAATVARTRAHAAYLERGEPIRAAATAIWLAFSLVDQPDQRAHAAGWFARARRLVDDAGTPCVERGWLLCAAAYQRVLDNDAAGAHAGFADAVDVGRQFGNADLVAISRHGQGRALLRLNRAGEGLALLDEVMIAVTSGEVGPLITGIVYCGVISACHDLFDMRRAHEWTAAMERWCAANPEVVPFRVQCVVHRSEALRWHGSWQDAFDEVQRACERMGSPPDAGAAYYQLAELHRLRGEFSAADEHYRLASHAGRKPNPGLALLRLAQGQRDQAATAIRLALREARERRARVHLLRAAVEILLATGAIDEAQSAAGDLAGIAASADAPFLRAVSAHMSGAVSLAQGRTDAALQLLREAADGWQGLDAPFERAKTREMIGLAYRQLGDDDGAQLEFDAALEAFERLGAAPDAARVTAFTAQTGTPVSGGLTGREVEVLRLIATGATNRAIATRLRISEKTVARHVSNILTKLDLSSRAAATAYAYEHKLLT